MKRVLAIAIGLALLGGCATSAVMLGNSHPPLDVWDVKVYAAAPAGAEVVAQLSAVSDWTGDSGARSVIASMKKRAAKLGANGLVLQGTAFNYQTGSQGSAIAVYVPAGK